MSIPDSRTIVVSAVGMPSSLGLFAEQTFTSVRAGLRRMSEAPHIYFCDPEDPDFDAPTPLVAAHLSYLEDERNRKSTPVEWLAHIAAEAFLDLVSKITLATGEGADRGFFLALPENRPGWDATMEEEFSYHFHDTAEIDRLPTMRHDFTGRAGVFTLIEEAARALQEGKITSAIVGGVDSYLFPEWLKPLDRDYRIKSPRNVGGFIPGELAAFFLLEGAGQAEKQGRKPLGFIQKVIRNSCTGLDLIHKTGMTLSEILKPLLAATPLIPLIVCDLNGEPGRMKEWGYTLTRLGESLGTPVVMEHPVEALGDCGAATGAMLIVLACLYLQAGYKNKASALIWWAGENGERLALLLRRP